MSNSNLGPPMYQDGLEYILAETKMLNRADLPEGTIGGFYLKVQLMDESGVAFGEWSDEISTDCWSYSAYNKPIEPKEE